LRRRLDRRVNLECAGKRLIDGRSGSARLSPLVFDQRARELLERPALLGVVCTIRADGSPQANPVWFRVDGDCIQIWTDERRRWVANLKRDPRVGFSVHENEAPWSSVSVRGSARIDLPTPAKTLREIREIAARYLPSQEIDAYVAEWPQTRSIVTIEPRVAFTAQAFEDPIAHHRA
jgi:PPOX class probable F420-dependent enzyme